MNHKIFVSSGLSLTLMVFMSVGLSLAENPSPQENSVVSSVGQPKLFWYERTFGETEVAFFADTAHLYNPEGVGVDSAGNLWVAETLGARVLKYSGDGAFLMSIGEAGRVWLADNKHISVPMDVAVDGAGNIWAVDQNSKRVVKYEPDGDYLMQLGVTWEGGSDNAHFADPWGVAFDSAGDIYVSDAGNHRIQVFGSNGVYKTTIGVTGVSGSDNAHFNSPWRIAIDGDDNLYVADLWNHRLQIFDASHSYVATLGVSSVSGSDNSHFDVPGGVAVDANRIYVADRGNHRVQIFNRATRAYQTTLSIGGGSGNNQFDWPGDVAVDSAGNIYVADELNSRVQKFNSSLVYVRTFGTTDVPYLTDNYHYNMPYGVAVDADGNIGIVEDERRGHRFIKLDASGAPQFTIGVAGVTGSDEAHFANPRGVAVDASGNIYIADSSNHRVQIYNSIRIYVATLGVTGVAGTDNSHFNEPNDVEVDASGNIYVADSWNGRVQKFNSSRAWQMTLDQFWGPSGVAVDLLGNIYVAVMWPN